ARHRRTQVGIQRQTQPVSDDRRMRCGQTRGKSGRRSPVQHLAYRKVVEVGSSLALTRIPVSSHNATCWQGVESGVNAGGWLKVNREHNDEEDMLVATVRAFIDRDVKPTVRQVEHANTYPDAWIEQMKRIGIYGLAVP